MLLQHQSQYDMSANSAPADLVQWNQSNNMNEDAKKLQQHQISSSNQITSRLNPLASVYLPVKATSFFPPGKSRTKSTAKDTKHSTSIIIQEDTKGKVRKDPSKRQPVSFPGQKVMTTYLLPRKFTTPHISQPISLPTQGNRSTTEEAVLSTAPKPDILQVTSNKPHQTSSSNHFASRLNPLAPAFLPAETTSPLDPGKSSNFPTTKDTKHSTTISTQKDTKGKVRKGPSKRHPIFLPDQNVITKYLPPRKLNTPTISQSMSLPTQENSSTSEQDALSPLPETETLQVAFNKTQEPKNYISSQRTLFDFTFFKPQAKISPEDPDIFGHVPQQIDSARTFRIILQNPNGIKPSVTEPDFMFSLHLCYEVGAAQFV
jgi:hypothetical protein